MMCMQPSAIKQPRYDQYYQNAAQDNPPSVCHDTRMNSKNDWVGIILYTDWS